MNDIDRLDGAVKALTAATHAYQTATSARLEALEGAATRLCVPQSDTGTPEVPTPPRNGTGPLSAQSCPGRIVLTPQPGGQWHWDAEGHDGSHVAGWAPTAARRPISLLRHLNATEPPPRRRRPADALSSATVQPPRTLKVDTRMAVQQRRNERADRAGWILQHHTAELITAWLSRQQELMEDAADGRVSDNAGRVKGAGATVFVPADDHGPDERIPVTSVEAIVMRGEMMRDRREEVRDRLDGIVLAINSLNTMLRRDLRGTSALLRIPELCDGTARGYEGHRLAWRPYDRSMSNGWADATCRQAAGRSGCCPSCLLRMNRWRERNGLSWITDGNEEHDSAALRVSA